MKRFLSIILLLTAMACEKENIAYNRDFDRSLNAWQTFKQTSGNSYRYTVTAGTWAGSGWKTNLIVTKGKVTERHFTYTVFHDIRMPANGWDEAEVNKILALMKTTAEEFKARNGVSLAEVLSWSETGSNLGAHKNTSAADLITLDDVYAKAETQWLLKRKGVSVYFEAKNSGMISSCGFVNDGCQDDCFIGINISEIKAL
ncbi:hypothetical protein [Emticicia sp. 21SJ11W-3]|uniref:hypothetical protein n=1 Tax=Emticicia sp. 21SJ11W-3 TaxID=2916755 RepID=UPI00209DC17A|nr:hypothetical protein [Emticicia sp. 21SJ11W-3]UTA66847.1 hypothetical protein MB380_14675 [Emticicia sp. 21SJ11W-3]